MQASIGSRVMALARRCFVAYLLLSTVPFPLHLIPVVDGWMIEARRPWLVVVEWVGREVLGASAVPRNSGSGDAMYYYVSALCIAVVAVVVALVWPRLAGTRALSSRVLDRSRAYMCLYLGSYLLVYGWNKLIPTQMPIPGPDRVIVPYGDSSPMGLLWTFMGASAGYQMLTGLVEVVSGSLLFWRRTWLLGGLLSLLAMSNVVALNFCYGVPVKLFSAHLLVIALFIVAPDLGRLVDLLWHNRPVVPRAIDPHPIARRGWWWAARLSKIGLYLIVSISGIVVGGRYLMSKGRLAQPGPLHGVFRVVSFSRDGVTELPDAVRWVRVGINEIGIGAIQRADGSSERFKLKIQEDGRRMVWQRIGEDTSFSMFYPLLDSGEFRLAGSFEAGWTVAILERQDEPPLLTSREFRWIQERPFNR
ncbi:MAG: hypothetical protein IPO88_21325 [Nannocystis sp.]|uniref:hypothetical protein n=1 Tax=Nannocystis sp. TaxID=1962667 RepID=UPI0024299026|nr:hypothetical protein [Nannocystis sp.]MBK9755995.1 hypothetical protein [Nannocystis sp.]